MENGLGKRFIKASLVFLTIAATVGVIYSFNPVRDWIATCRYMIEFHAHLALIGWVSLAILGLIYCCLEDKKVEYDETFGHKGFWFLIIGSIMMPFMLLINGIAHISSIDNDNIPIIDLTTISAIILLIGIYMSAYNIYRALSSSKSWQ